MIILSAAAVTVFDVSLCLPNRVFPRSETNDCFTAREQEEI